MVMLIMHLIHGRTEEMRNQFKTPENPSPQYNQSLREKMKNSLTLGEEEVTRLLSEEPACNKDKNAVG